MHKHATYVSYQWTLEWERLSTPEWRNRVRAPWRREAWRRFMIARYRIWNISSSRRLGGGSNKKNNEQCKIKFKTERKKEVEEFVGSKQAGWMVVG